jgi:hypothetical protein
VLGLVLFAPRATTSSVKSWVLHLSVGASAIWRNVAEPSKVTDGSPLMPTAVKIGWLPVLG